MKRDQRLYDLVQILRDGKLHTAEELGRQLGVSTRTVWRDMAIMAATGLPVTGERGLGYLLRSPLMLPPTVLTPDELEALASGLRHVEAHDPQLARAAKSLLYKIATLLPQTTLAAEAGLAPTSSSEEPQKPSSDR